MKLKSVFLVFFFLMLTSSLSASSEKFKKDSVYIITLIDSSRGFAIERNSKEAIRIARIAQKIAIEGGHKKYFPRTLFYVAMGHEQVGNIDSAIHYYTLMIELFKNSTNSNNWIYHTYNNLLQIHRREGNYDECVRLYMEEMEFLESKKDSSWLAVVQSDLGYVFDRMKEYRLSILWQQKANQYFKSNNDSNEMATAFTRIGIAYDELGQYDSAHIFNEISLEINRAIKDTISIIKCLNNIGNTFIKEKNWLKAEEYLKKVLELKDYDLAEDYTEMLANINISVVYINQEKFQLAERHLKKALSLSNYRKDFKFTSEIYYKYHLLYQAQGKYDSALHYYQKFSALEDTLYSIDKTNQILDLNAKYETEKKTKEIEIQNIKLSKKENELRARQRAILVLILFIILILVFSYGLYKRYQARKEAELQSRIIAEQEKGIHAVFQAQEEERKRISKDLHDGVGQQLSGIKMAFHRIAKTLQEKNPEQKEAMDKLGQVIAESADEVRSISHQMMPRVLTEVGLVEAIQGMLEKSLKLSGVEFEFEQFGMTERLPEQLEVGLYRVCQELINNIIKHSGAKQVNVQLMKNKKNIVLLVEDDGLGISPSKSEGHGLLNMKSRINTLNGEVNLEPSPTRGTLATIRVPL